MVATGFGAGLYGGAGLGISVGTGAGDVEWTGGFAVGTGVIWAWMAVAANGANVAVGVGLKEGASVAEGVGGGSVAARDAGLAGVEAFDCADTGTAAGLDAAVDGRVADGSLRAVRCETF